MFLAKLAEQAERYDEMVAEMKKVAQMVHDQELSVEERNLLSVAYKNVIGARRASWRIISSIEQKEEAKGNEEHVKRIKAYREVVEKELQDICSSILQLLDDHLIPTASTGESKVFYLKMKGDYHRYLAEFKTGTERKEAAEHTLLAYKAAQDIALVDLPPTTPSALASLSTSLSSTTRSSTHQSAPATWPSRRLTRRLLSWTHWERRATRTAPSSCSCCATTSRCGPVTCRTLSRAARAAPRVR